MDEKEYICELSDMTGCYASGSYDPADANVCVEINHKMSKVEYKYIEIFEGQVFGHCKQF